MVLQSAALASLWGLSPHGVGCGLCLLHPVAAVIPSLLLWGCSLSPSAQVRAFRPTCSSPGLGQALGHRLVQLRRELLGMLGLLRGREWPWGPWRRLPACLEEQGPRNPPAVDVGAGVVPRHVGTWVGLGLLLSLHALETLIPGEGLVEITRQLRVSRDSV